MNLPSSLRSSDAAPVFAAVSTPIESSDRIGEIDITRGLALFGVVWMNLYEFGLNVMPQSVKQGLATAPVDSVVGFLSSWLAQGKAVTLFAILFGFGFSMFSERVEQRGGIAGRLYLRRLLVLLVFGMAHFVLLWYGDILHDYALVGMLLPLVRRWPMRLVLTTGMLMASFSALAYVVCELALLHADIGVYMATRQKIVSAYWQALTQGDYAGLMHANALFIDAQYFSLRPMALWGWIFGLFLVGVWVFRTGWLRNPATHRRTFVRAARGLIPTGLVLAGLLPAADFAEKSHLLATPLLSTGLHLLAKTLLEPVSALVLAMGYAAGILVLCSHPRVRPHLAGFGALGRMALTNYVTQSFVYFFVLYGFGLGLLPKLGASYALLMAIVVTALQIAFSRWWLARHRFGPLEWLWRSATYGSWQPLRQPALAHQT